MESIKPRKQKTIYKDDKSIEHFKYIRPNLVKLFTHLILLYLSIKGYMSFISTEKSYSDFLAELDKPVVVDVKMINSSSSCPSNYTEISTTIFPEISNGCRCDMNYFVDVMCPFIEAIAKKSGSEDTWKTTCSQQDLKGTTGRLLQAQNNVTSNNNNTIQTSPIQPQPSGQPQPSSQTSQPQPSSQSSQPQPSSQSPQLQNSSQPQPSSIPQPSSQLSQFQNSSQPQPSSQSSQLPPLSKPTNSSQLQPLSKPTNSSQPQNSSQLLPSSQLTPLSQPPPSIQPLLPSLPPPPPKPIINHFKGIPNKCDCYANITGIKSTKTIDTWFPNKKLCILKDNNLTTLKYLSSAMDSEDCEQDNLCQTYFCKSKFTSDVTKPCPVVDIYFDHKFNKTNGNRSIIYVDNKEWNLHADTFYNQMFISNQTFENTIIPPMIGISISRSGKCATGPNSLYSDHPLLKKIDCPLDQKYYSISKLPLEEVLINNNYLDEVLKIPGMNRSLTNENKWSLDSQYGFYKFSLTCLMENYDKIHLSKVSSLNQTILGDFTYKQRKIAYILQGFLEFTTNYQYQNYLQLIILGLNAILVIVSILTIFLKIFSYCLKCRDCYLSLFSFEIYFSFFIELGLGVLGGSSYFIMTDYINFLDSLVNSGCVDNYVQYKFGVFNQSLGDSSDQNLEVFFIVLLKIVLIIISTIYYTCYLEKMTCSHFGTIIKENIGDGQEEGNDEQDESSILKIHHENYGKNGFDVNINKYPEDNDRTKNDNTKIHQLNPKSLFDKDYQEVSKNIGKNDNDSNLPINNNKQYN